MSRRAFAVLGLALASPGCHRGGRGEGSALDPLEASNAEGLRIVEQVGAAPFAARVLSVNALGARVPGTEAQVSVDGASQTVTFDAHGLGAVTLSDPGLYTLASAQTAPARVVVAERPFDGFDLASVRPDRVPIDAAWSSPSGVVYQRDGRLWWWGVGRAPEPALDVPGEVVRGVRVEPLDGDGVDDAVVWTTRRLFVLRGTPDRGLAWAEAFEVSEPVVLGGVSIGDATGDGAPDLIVGVRGGSDGGVVEVLEGGDLLRFEAAERHEVVVEPDSVAFGVDRTRGRQFFEIVSASGGYARYGRAEGEDELTLDRDVSPVELAPGTEVLGRGDFTGDGLDDTFLVAPRVDGAPRRVVAVDFGASPVRFTERAPTAAQVALADADGDGLVDLWTLDASGGLRLLTASSGTQVEWSMGTLSSSGPFAVAQLDGRASVDVAASGVDRWVVWPGEPGVEGPWRLRGSHLDNLLVDVRRVGPLVALEDPPGAARWAGVQERDGAIWLKAWRRDPAATTVTELSRAKVTDAPSSWVDVAFCGPTAWVLVAARLARYDVGDVVRESWAVEGVVGTAVACRDDGWAGVLAGDQVRLVREGDDEVVVPAAGLVALALGSGETPEVVGCAVEGCGVALWEVGGAEVRVVGGRDSAEVVSDDGLVLPFPGRPVVADADGDGQDDLVVLGPTGTVTVVRATPDGPGAPEVWQVDRALGGSGFLADGDGDGVRELFAVGSDGVMFTTAPSP